jgi:hypothetical protein
VERFGSQKKGRIVKYDSTNNHLSCSCCYTNFSGIVCRHIFKVAAQLNLEELPLHLFLIRWRKDPSENVLAKIYKLFYNNIGELETNQSETANKENDHEDYIYLLNRTWYKVQQIVKAKPELAKNFYILLDKSVKEEISTHISDKTSQVQDNKKIKNPAIIKPKGIVFIF